MSICLKFSLKMFSSKSWCVANDLETVSFLESLRREHQETYAGCTGR